MNQKIIWGGIAVVVIAGAAGMVAIKKTGKSANTAAVSASPTLKPADAIDPASGICQDFPKTDTATVNLNDDVPDPKCMKVLPNQKLKVVNNTQGEISVYLGDFYFRITPGGEYITDKAIGSILAPGVHVPVVAPGSGPEIWVQRQ